MNSFFSNIWQFLGLFLLEGLFSWKGVMHVSRFQRRVNSQTPVALWTFPQFTVMLFRGQIVPINNQIVPQKHQFVPHMLYLFSKFVNVIWVQSSARNMDESIFRTIHIVLRALYVNFTVQCRTMWELFNNSENLCLSIFDHNTENKIKYYMALRVC